MSEQTTGQRVVEKWREDWRGLHLPPSGTSCTDLAARFDAELAKIEDLAEVAKYLNSPDRPKRTLDLRQILQWDLASNGISEDGVIRHEKFWPVSKVVEAIRQQLPDVEVTI